MTRSRILGNGLLAALSLEASYYVDYDGDTAIIDCGSGASIDDLPGSGDFTIDGWIKPDGAGEASQGHVATKGGANGWAVLHYAGGLGFLIKMSGGLDGTWDGGWNQSSGAWHHFAVTWDNSTNNIRIYVDGTLTAGPYAPGGTASSDASASLHIGNSAGFRGWDGGIGWIRLSNSRRWTANFTAPDQYPAPDTDGNTVALYRMTEGSGTSVADASGNSNTGTLSGTYVWTALS